MDMGSKNNLDNNYMMDNTSKMDKNSCSKSSCNMNNMCLGNCKNTSSMQSLLLKRLLVIQ